MSLSCIKCHGRGWVEGESGPVGCPRCDGGVDPPDVASNERAMFNSLGEALADWFERGHCDRERIRNLYDWLDGALTDMEARIQTLEKDLEGQVMGPMDDDVEYPRIARMPPPGLDKTYCEHCDRFHSRPACEM